MKKIHTILLLLLLTMVQKGWSQSLTNHDPSVKSPKVTIKENQKSGKLSFLFVQQLSAYELNSKKQPVRMIISLMNIKLKDGIASIDGNYAKRFDWQYDEAQNYLLATQKATLEKDELGEIEIDFLTNQAPSCEENIRIGFNVNIQPAAHMNGVNKIENDNVHHFTCQPTLLTSLSKLETTQYEIYPNPTKEQVTLAFTEIFKDLKVTLYDGQGKVAKESIYNNTNLARMEVAQLPPGIYTVRLQTVNKTATEKLIIIR